MGTATSKEGGVCVERKQTEKRQWRSLHASACGGCGWCACVCLWARACVCACVCAL